MRPEHQALGVDDEPAALDLGGFGGVGGHASVLGVPVWWEPRCPRRSGQGRRTSVASIPVAAKVELVGIEAIRAARAGLEGSCGRTPVEEADTLSRMAGRPVLLKPEHRQRTGSFKIRGRYTHVAALPDDGARVVAASAGNHAQGVALAASLAGRRSSIFMPSGAPLPKVEATRAYGADVRLVGVTVDDCMLEARAAAELERRPPRPAVRRSARDRRPGHDRAGDRRRDRPRRRGGGRAGRRRRAGRRHRRRAARRCGPSVRVIGVEAEGAAAMQASLAAGTPVRLDAVDTIADGIAVKTPSRADARPRRRPTSTRSSPSPTRRSAGR